MHFRSFAGQRLMGPTVWSNFMATVVVHFETGTTLMERDCRALAKCSKRQEFLISCDICGYQDISLNGVRSDCCLHCRGVLTPHCGLLRFISKTNDEGF